MYLKCLQKSKIHLLLLIVDKPRGIRMIQINLFRKRNFILHFFEFGNNFSFADLRELRDREREREEDERRKRRDDRTRNRDR